MPSFDVVSEVDMHELTNAVDQAQRIIETRFDFKGVEASFERDDNKVVISAEADFQLTQLEDMLRGALVKCGIDPLAMECGSKEGSGKLVRETVVLKNGLESSQCKAIVKRIKEEKRITPAFIFAVFLWDSVVRLKAKYLERGMSESQTLTAASEAVISGQSRRIAIPRRFHTSMRDIWYLQDQGFHQVQIRVHSLRLTLQLYRKEFLQLLSI